MNVNHEKWLLDAEEVSRLLNIGKSTVYKLAANRDLPKVCINVSIRFLVEDVIQYIKDNRNKQ